MATAAFEDLAETFGFLDDWEDRYRHLIELGRAMPPLDDSFKVPALKVEGCASQVWLRPQPANGVFDFEGDSDAMIVRGLIAVLHALYAGVPVAEVARIDAPAELGRLGLNDHLSAQRSNGLRAMV
ncbi:MAG: cysteine desufuration protein SufE, partial [Rhodobacterales bacterium 12-65-15]